MPSFSGISLALQSVLTHQQAIEVIQHNVANASTPGYHRQEAVLRPGPNQGAAGLVASTLSGKVGTGVVLSQVKRFNLDYMDTRYRSEVANTKRWEVESDFMTQVEGALNETGTTGINAKLDAFWTGWKSVSTDPEDTALRASLLEAGKQLASAFNGRMEDLTQIQNDADLKIYQNVDEINQLAQQVANLNLEIGRFANESTQPNDFLDEQARYLDRLAELAGAKIVFEDNGQAMVSLAGHVLVQGGTGYSLVAEENKDNANMVDVKWNEPGDRYLYKYTENGEYLDKYITSGELAGLFEVRDVVISGEKDNLNGLAYTIFTNINSVHSAGYGLEGDSASTTNFFLLGEGTTSDTINSALSIKVNPTLDDVTKIRAAQSQGVSGDGRNAELIFKFQTQSTHIYVTDPDYPDIPLTTPYKELSIEDNINHANSQRVAEFGLTVQKINTLEKQHSNLTDVMDQQRESVNGVSLDEEAANLVKYQRSYQASIRLMTTVDEMLDRIINNMGLAGR